MDDRKIALNQAAEFIGGWLDLNFRQSRLTGLAVAVQWQDRLIFSACLRLGRHDQKAAADGQPPV